MRHGCGTSADELINMAATLRQWIHEVEGASEYAATALGTVDVLAALWHTAHEPCADGREHDRLLLSRGHAILAAYAALRWQELIDVESFRRLCRSARRGDGESTILPPGVDAFSVSQGLSAASGMAYGMQSRGSKACVYVLVSATECEDAQFWETVMFAAHRHLTNLCVAVEVSGAEADETRNGDIHLLEEKWSRFGWDCQVVDGHDVSALVDAFCGPAEHHPRVVLARTVLGKALPTWGSIDWCHVSMDVNPSAAADIEASG